jgi:hypothetical protein
MSFSFRIFAPGLLSGAENRSDLDAVPNSPGKVSSEIKSCVQRAMTVERLFQ